MATDAQREPMPGRLLVRTSSVEEAEKGAARLLSPHRLRVGRGGFDARIHGVSLGSVALYHLNYGTAVTVSGPPLDGYVGALLPLRGAIRVNHCRARFEAAAQRSAAVITPQSPMVLEWSPDLSMFLVRIESAPLRSFARSMIGRDDAEIRFDPRMTEPSGVAALLGSARLIELAAGQLAPHDPWPAAIATRIREQVMLSLLLTQPELRERMLAEVRGPVTREAVRKATEIVECEPTSHPTTAGLAAAAGVSVRALQVGFREVLDTTPQAYMLEVRLRRAHDELRGAQAEEGATVTRIARRWGFGNVGRFAEQYRQAYGEKPSETLRHS